MVTIRFDEQNAVDTDGYGWQVVHADGTLLHKSFRYRADACAWCVANNHTWEVWHGPTRMG